MKARALIVLLPLALSMWSCARPPEAGEPIAASELEELAARIGEGMPTDSSFRGRGEAEIAASGRTLRVSFALIYERPGWLRADLRPSLGTMGASLTAQGLVDGGCARLYFPARLIEVTGCMTDVTSDAAWLDSASLIVGLPDPALLAGMEDATVSRAGDRTLVRGRVGETPVEVTIVEPLSVIESISLGSEDGDAAASVSYDGFGWKPGLKAPEVVRFTARQGTTHETEITLRYDTLRAAEPVDRGEYALTVPPGVASIDWKELNIWRQE